MEHRDDCQLTNVPVYGLCTCDFDERMPQAELSAHEPQDNYTKKTCLWTGGGFVMPQPFPLRDAAMPDDRIHKASPGPQRANFRSATPMGFARAVFEANHKAALKMTAE